MQTKLKATPGPVFLDTMGRTVKARNVKAVLGPEGKAITDDETFLVEIEDDGGGEFISICQPPDYHKLLINPHEWPALKKLVDKMVRECLA